jgi:hypothetical protein
MDNTRAIFYQVARVGYGYKFQQVLEVWAGNQFPKIINARIDSDTWDLYITVENGEEWRFKDYLMNAEYLKDVNKWAFD